VASKRTLVPILLPADPTAALEAATKQYVDARIQANTVSQPGTPTDGSGPTGTQPVLWVDTDDVLPASAGMVIPGGALGTFLQKKTASDFDLQWAVGRVWITAVGASGPYPLGGGGIGITLPFKADVLVVFHASCYVTATGMNGLAPMWDGANMALWADSFWNVASQHMWVGTPNILRAQAAGNHTLNVNLYANATSDANDRCRFGVTAVEVP
jgi:hypothetical protein